MAKARSPRSAADQRSEIGLGDVDWDDTFSTLRDIEFDDIISVCAFGRHEKADAFDKRTLERISSELRSS